MNLATILEAVKAATNVATVVAQLVAGAKEVFNEADQAEIQRALENLQHANDELFTTVQAALEVAAKK